MDCCQNYMSQVFYPYYKELYDKIKAQDFVIDKSGCKTVEIIAPRIEYDLLLANGGFIDYTTRKSPRKYIINELEWYNSKDLNIKMVDSVKIWTLVCDENQNINSNYGHLVYGKGNFSQFSHALHNLEENKFSRQAIIIYTRPSIQLEHNDLGGADFICTNFQQFFIRDNKLHCVTSMRSNDCWSGCFSDQPWFVYVAYDMYEHLKPTYPDLSLGKMVFIPNSFHCYERNFDRLVEMIETK